MTKATISILSMASVEMSRRCIESVRKSTRAGDYHLILTSNGNPEIAEYFLSLEEEGDVNVIVNPENLGFIKPNNLAFEVSDTPFFICLNDDAEVPDGWLDMMLAEFEKYPTAAIVGSSGTCCELNDSFIGKPGRIPEYIEGSCMCVRSDLIKPGKLFEDERLLMAYGEDVDLSLRMRERGHTLHFAPFSIVHQRSSTSRNLPWIRDILRHNHDYMHKRWGGYIKNRRFDYDVVVRRRGALGDVLLTTPVIRALKEQRPECRIFVETDCPAIFRDNPDVAMARRSFGVLRPDVLLIDLDMVYERKTQANIIQSYAEEACVRVTDEQLSIFPNGEEIHWAKEILGDGSWVAIHSGPSTWPGKQWPVERFIKVAHAIQEMGYRIVLVGSNSSHEIPMGVDRRGKDSIHQTAALLFHCDLLISLDSFPMHLAIAVGTPAIGLFGITDPKYIVPKAGLVYPVCSDPNHPFSGARHRVANATFVDCGNQNPMETIPAQTVLDASGELLAYKSFSLRK